MHAVQFDRFGPPEVLHTVERPVPEPVEAEVLVRVAAVGVGRLLDVAARAGRHPYPRFALPHIPGAEHSGVVAALGSGASGFAVGDRVAVFPGVSDMTCPDCRDGRTEACPALEIIGIHRPGACAEFVAVPAVNLHPVPEGVGPAEAAALALCGAVAANQLRQAGLREGDWVLVQGGASALGCTTAALARHLGARVIVTSRSAAKRAVLRRSGFVALDTAADDVDASVRDLTRGRGVDVVVDNLGDPGVWRTSLACLATGGTVVCSGAFLGGRVELDLTTLYSRCQRIVGVRTGSLDSARAAWREVDRGFRPVIDRTFPASCAAQAHHRVEADANVGRVVLLTGSSQW
jgi:NADPH:quinone reductase-like Zn-dependent oxidoreductase